MPSAAAAASFPIPKPAPITIMPRPIATLIMYRLTILSLHCASVMNVDSHADEYGRQEREHVRLDQHYDDLEPGNADRQWNRDDEPHADAGDGAAEHLGEQEHE